MSDRLAFFEWTVKRHVEVFRDEVDGLYYFGTDEGRLVIPKVFAERIALAIGKGLKKQEEGGGAE